MNQKGEITLISCLLILTLSGVVLICSMELQGSFKLLKKRTDLFLCVKETKGEINQYLKFMGRTNWGIKNINRASMIMVFIPGLQGAAMDAQKAKKYIQYAQEARTISYLKTLTDIKKKQCFLDPRMFLTPFALGSRLLKRDAEGAAIIREAQWEYYFFSKPYLLSLKIQTKDLERIKPRPLYTTEEKGEKLSFLLSSQWR